LAGRALMAMGASRGLLFMSEEDKWNRGENMQWLN